ncbi:uncharacterized protein BJX67DRAFT_365824 [Aspergillus lucknowensis]|uniref:DUF7730 domain-containing protein n=1 Tax=Aspergillus lucknowensis TaxID=176173 RepID=A0ABR4LDU0_9EURO
MNSFKKWTRRITRKPPTVYDPSKSLPFLVHNPSPQPTDAEFRLYLTNYGIFARLPVEIRQQILILAFGNRTLHVDLQYCRPRTAHRGDSAAASTWQWVGCVCHREEQPVERLQCCDPCLQDLPSSCKSTNLPIGAMGFLLACHMSYQETITTLFTTNTFRFETLELQLHLPRLIPPDSLSWITSLELIWDLVKPRARGYSHRDNLLYQLLETDGTNSSRKSKSSSPSSVGVAPLHQLCRMVPGTFPHLRYLYISLHSHIAPPSNVVLRDPLEEVERVILHPIEDMIHVLNPERKKEINIAIQQGGWEAFLRRQRRIHDDGNVMLEGSSRFGPRFWKGIEHANSNCNHDSKPGYWLCAGWDDIGAHRQFYDEVDFWGERAR